MCVYAHVCVCVRAHSCNFLLWKKKISKTLYVIKACESNYQKKWSTFWFSLNYRYFFFQFPLSATAPMVWLPYSSIDQLLQVLGENSANSHNIAVSQSFPLYAPALSVTPDSWLSSSQGVKERAAPCIPLTCCLNPI